MNAASSARWAERPVERIVLETRPEEEEDKEAARYVFNRRWGNKNKLESHMPRWGVAA